MPLPERDSAARWILVLALVVGFLRFWKLGQWSLWFDEAATFTDYFVGIEGGEITNPLGYRLIHATVEFLGGRPDEFALRFLPALAGWASIAMTAWAFRPLAGARVASIAALFVAASSWEIYWSQNARFYTLAALVSLLGTGVFVRGFASASTIRVLLGLAIAGAAALFHSSAALLLPALLIAPWIAARRSRLDLGPRKRVLVVTLVLAVLGGLGAVSWARDTLGQYLLQKGAADPFGDIPHLVSRVAHLAKTTGFYFTPLLCAAAIVGAWIAWKRFEASRILAVVVVVIVLATAVVLAAAGARMTAQYVFFLFPWIALLAALPAEQLGLRVDPRARTAVLDAHVTTPRMVATAWSFVLVACALVNTALYFTVRQGERPPWRDAYQFVWNRRGANDLVLGMEATVGEYYLAPYRTELRQPEHVQWLDRWRATQPDLWSRHARRMWLIVNPEQFLDWAPADAAEVQRFLREECRLVKCWPLSVESRDLSVWVYVRD